MGAYVQNRLGRRAARCMPGTTSRASCRMHGVPHLAVSMPQTSETLGHQVRIGRGASRLGLNQVLLCERTVWQWCRHYQHA